MKIECMKNLIYTFVGSVTLVLLTSCSAEFENGTPEPWQRSEEHTSELQSRA